MLEMERKLKEINWYNIFISYCEESESQRAKVTTKITWVGSEHACNGGSPGFHVLPHLQRRAEWAWNKTHN